MAIRNFKDMVDLYKGDFIENPLDNYKTYTYSLEWFVVNQEQTRKFQLQEAKLAGLIAKDEWPQPTTQYITIAKTAYTTEFNITNLNVVSVGSGNSNHSKVAGTADKIEFTVTQVGNTSLSDSVQTAIALCGYKSISDAVYFMKINFLGEEENGTLTKLEQTKVMPFKLMNYNTVNTSTDSRGTTTVIQGQVDGDIAVSTAYVSTIQHEFNYDYGMTLEKTLSNFFEHLNLQIDENNKHLDDSMKNSYAYEFSKQFKDVYSSSKMPKGKEGFVAKGKNSAIQIGESMPGQSIYGTIEEIVLQSDNIREELTKDNPSYTCVPRITPQLSLKIDGFNPIKGTQSYEITYFIDYQRKMVEQNMVDFLTKIKNNKANCLELFESGFVYKKYDYLFTGNNDQILNFEISLQAELIKTYITPTDTMKNIDFRKDNLAGRKLTEAHKELLGKLEGDVTAAKDAYDDQQIKIDSVNKKRSTFGNTYKDKILTAMGNHKKFKDEDIEEKYGSLDFGELMTELKIAESSAGDIAKRSEAGNVNKVRYVAGINVHVLRRKYEKFQDKIVELQEALKKGETTLAEAKKSFQETFQDITATNLKLGATDDLSAKLDGYKSSTDSIFKELRSKNKQGVILAEELGDDYITTMSNDNFRTILTAQAQNPIQFKRLIYKDADGNFTGSTSENADASLMNARTKYYEAKNGEVSMFYADMTIKGDPFFIEGYMPAKTKKVLFGNGGKVLDTSFAPVNSFLNGFPHIVLESKIAKGVDDYDNVLVSDMILSLYAVKSISSDFSGGLFTQTLSLVKNASAEHFTDNEEIADVVEAGDLNTNLENTPKTQAELDAIKGAEQAKLVAAAIAAGYNIDEIPKYLQELQNKKDARIDNHFSMNDGYPLGGAYGTGVTGGPPDDSTIKEKIVDFFSPITSLFTSSTKNKVIPSITAVETTIENTVATLAPSALNPTGDLGKHSNPAVDNIVRYNNGVHFVNNVGTLTNACRAKVAGACEAKVKAENDLLATLGIPPEDKGKASTVTAVNKYFNDVIADPGTNAGFVLNDSEVAAYQMAVGGELNITGHDSADIQKIVKKATGENTPNIIIDEIKAGTYGAVSVLPLGASVDNNILNGSEPLINEEVVEVLINTPEYTWEEQMYKDQVKYPNANIDWKNTHWFKASVDEAVTTTKVFNPKTRKFEIKKIDANILTAKETLDVKILKESIESQIDLATITSDDVAEEWYAESSGALAAKMLQEGISLDEIAKAAHADAMKNKIVNSIKVDSLSDAAWENVSKSVDAINHINASATSGIRGNLTDAVNTKSLGEKLNTDVSTATELKTKTGGYYFDYLKKKEDLKTLDDVHLEIAKNHLAMPEVTTTAVRTITTGGDIEYIPVTNPVSQIRIDMQPILVKTSKLNTLDVYLPSARGDDLTAKNVSVAEVAQLDEARKIYQLITNMEYHGDTVEVNDDYLNEKVIVKDYNNLPSITYVDSSGTNQTISNPSAYFGLYTNTFDDSNPASLTDYTHLKEKISDLFPVVTVGREVEPGEGINTGNGLMIVIKHNQFYIDKTKPPGSTIW